MKRPEAQIFALGQTESSEDLGGVQGRSTLNSSILQGFSVVRVIMMSKSLHHKYTSNNVSRGQTKIGENVNNGKWEETLW